MSREFNFSLARLGNKKKLRPRSSNSEKADGQTDNNVNVKDVKSISEVVIFGFVVSEFAPIIIMPEKKKGREKSTTQKQ